MITICHLVYIPQGVPCGPELLEAMANAGQSNRDGYGYSVINDEGDGFISHKTMSLVESIESFQEARAKHMGHAIWHARYGTHGTDGLENVHPFVVAKDPMTVMAHNGVLPMSTWPSSDGKNRWRSDTNIFCRQHLSQWGMRLDSKRFTDHVLKFIGHGSKLVFLTINPKYQANVYIFNQELGDWDTDTGCWHSNTAHKWAARPKSYYPGHQSIWGDDGDGWWNDDRPSVNGIEIGRPNSSYTPGRQVQRHPGVDEWISGGYVRDAEGEWQPFRSDSNGQRVLTEADVIAAHGYVPKFGETMELDEECQTCGSHEYDITNLRCASCGDPGLEFDAQDAEPCPTCGSVSAYDATWTACTSCMHCGSCNRNMADGSCGCYTPEWLRYKYGVRS